jgi:hypothetical protein
VLRMVPRKPEAGFDPAEEGALPRAPCRPSS